MHMLVPMQAAASGVWLPAARICVLEPASGRVPCLGARRPNRRPRVRIGTSQDVEKSERETLTVQKPALSY
jgi:hypothetical protein